MYFAGGRAGLSNQFLYLSDPQGAIQMAQPLPFGRYLVNEGTITQADLLHALDLQRRIDAPLGEIMVAEGLIDRDDILLALSRQHGAQLVDLNRSPPDPRSARHLPVAVCQQFGVLPWLEVGGALMVATSRPDHFDHLRTCMGSTGRRMLPVIADERHIHTHLSQLYRSELAQKAATRVPAALSCRSWETSPARRRFWAIFTLSLLLLALVLAPLWVLSVAMIWALITLTMTTTLKAAAFWSQLTHHTPARTDGAALSPPQYRLPRVSVLVPLLREKEIADSLFKRLSRLTYPKSLLQVVLVLEEGDHVTRDTITRTELPHWINVIEVPEANGLTTKPRALNYALDFCRGSIIGVWDAEDAPEPDQIEKVVTRFHSAPANVACLQGMLDYYNSRSNWLARCFTIEYATWWRVILPGVARLGLVVPLGGTTLFFRRDILTRLGGWDAHNVTEDADLGLRLARHGYVTELLSTVTLEEANCRAWPWVRQRSRWLKGFLITWCVHMRAPRALLKDLGFLRFMGVQTMFLATVSQFAMAPLLWSFWLALLGMPHPVATTLGPQVMWLMAGSFVVAEVVNLGISMVAVSGRSHRHLLPWVLTLPFYFPLGVLAALKGLYEFVSRPFYWDKTAHGQTITIEEEPCDLKAARPLARPDQPEASIPLRAARPLA